ncbi:MAG: acetoacetate decarboxylase family protein [Actinobacteria bacterium]|nr:acetoacetate decarboxylase family protein [Actinomycetota bacterium]
MGGETMHHDFFDGVEQVEAQLVGKEAKLPVFYRSARAMTAVFPATVLALKKLIPDPRYSPAQMVPGIGALHLTAFEYYDTDIEPYNEFAIGVLLNDPHVLPVPGYNLLRQLIRMNFYTYIHHLPVNTEIALRGGIDIYNYPKFLADIAYTDSEQEVTCDLSQGGDLILRLTGQKISAARSGIMKYFCHLYQFKQLQGAEFKVNAIRYALVPAPGKVRLELGTSHPVAEELRRTLLTTQPLIYIYMPEIQCILYGPDRLSLPLLVRLLRENMGISLEELAARQAK